MKCPSGLKNCIREITKANTRRLLLYLLLTLIFHQGGYSQYIPAQRVQHVQSEDQMNESFYNFKVVDLQGNPFDFSQLKGKKVMIVNTASECGFTPQYAQLQKLYDAYGGDEFTIIGFPSNDFGGQEPGSHEEIANFCMKNYGVSFPMMGKVAIHKGEPHPLYQWLTKMELNGVQDASVGWNFFKFLIDEQGQWTAVYPSGVDPLDERILEFIQED